MLELHIRVLASEDIQDIVDYYDVISSLITDRFLKQLYTEFDLLCIEPELFQIKYKQTRVRYIKGFSFGIHYLITKSTIEILAVLHSSRNPNIALSR